MPWFVNACSDFSSAPFYKKRVKEILKMDEQDWERNAEIFYEEDKEISSNFVKQNMRHYAIKYNPFMGVISDYFIAEEGL